MVSKTKTINPQTKYWWLILIVLPVVLAVIAILPSLLHTEKSAAMKPMDKPMVEQSSDNVVQHSELGANINNVQGSSISIQTVPINQGAKP